MLRNTDGFDIRTILEDRVDVVTTIEQDMNAEDFKPLVELLGPAARNGWIA